MNEQNESQEIHVPPTVTVKRRMKDNKILVAFLSWVLYPIVFSVE